MVEIAAPKSGPHSCVVHPELKGAEPDLEGKYGRMFSRLPACQVDLEGAVGLGVAASRMDATLPIVDRALENPRIPAGFAILGQYIAHDITADRSLLAQHAENGELRNFRSPTLDLECLYGDGPVGNPYLFDARDPDKMLLGVDPTGEPVADLPRNQQGVALVGDPRNDVHLLISQLHLAFLRFHNRVVDFVRERGTPVDAVFEEARRLVRWHYEWIVAHEFLPLSAGDELVADILANGRRFYDPGTHPAIPVEFSDAAYRFGHAQINPVYRLNDQIGELTIFPDLLGGRPVPRERAIDWSLFFAIPGARPPTPSRKIVASLTHALIDLPDQIVGHTEVPHHHSLASRDLQRGAALGLPSGETIAREMGVAPLDVEECGLPEGFPHETPLWYYILKEAEVRADGTHLGPVGGRIVAEVLLGLLDADANSYRNAVPRWQPELPTASGAPTGDFTMADLLVFAGAV
ncbi:MAG: peroxidase [Chloroflexia bacterium]|nr:peroxidase [Chloroflexia bacterium]